MSAERVVFTFAGRPVAGTAGQSIGAALHAAGLRVLSASLKYRRPRGLYCVAGACPNCGVRVDGVPGVVACTTPLRGGEAVERDRGGLALAPMLERLSPLTPAGFYYERLARSPRLWRRAERLLARLAGGARLPNARASGSLSNARFEHRRVDVAVVGGGAAGLSAAGEAARRGAGVVLVEQDDVLGGWLLSRPGGKNEASRLGDAARGAGAELLVGACAFGWYEEGLLAVATADGLLALEPQRLVLATGTYERGLPFADGDRPGVVLAAGAQRLLVRDGVLVGRNVVVVTDEAYGHAFAALVADAGARVTVVDRRPRDVARADAGDDRNPPHAETHVAAAHGRRAVEAVSLRGPAGAFRIACDAVCLAVGRRPADELLAQRRSAGSIALEESRELPPNVTVVGGLAGDAV